MTDSPATVETLQVSRVMEVIGQVGSPVAIGSSLLYYFGWVRTTTQARILGYDAALAGYTFEDFILKSVNVLFLPLIVLLLCAAVLTALDRLLLGAVETSMFARTTVRVLAFVLRYAWALLIPGSVAIALSGGPGSFFAIPGALTVAMLGVLYASRLKRHLGQQPRFTRMGRIVVLTLLLLAVFWDTERLAQSMGRAFAADILANPSQLTAVSVVSKPSLGIATACVQERRIGAAEGGFNFRYDGLRLLHSSGGKQFLLSICAGKPHVFVLADGDTIRMEFATDEDSLT